MTGAAKYEALSSFAAQLLTAQIANAGAFIRPGESEIVAIKKHFDAANVNISRQLGCFCSVITNFLNKILIFLNRAVI